MKILAPLSQIDNYEPLVEAGADEFFCGILPYEWLKNYNATMPINRREYLFGNCNISSMSSMRSISKMVEHYKVPIKIAFNSHYFIPSQYPLLLESIRMLMDMGFDTFILADIALIIFLREKGFNCTLHLSGELQILNEHSMKFFDQFNITRFVFPRRANLSDMKNAIQNSGLKHKEYESFIMNSFCPYDGAFCNSIHSDEIQHLCWLSSRPVTSIKKQNIFKDIPKYVEDYRDHILSTTKKGISTLQEHNKQNQLVGSDGCGLCALNELEHIGITNLKVVGRGVSIEEIIRDIKVLKEIIILLERIKSKEYFSNLVIEKYFEGECHSSLCYYPDR